MNSVPVFIPALNEADKIATAIESVRWANVVIDTACTDDTIDITRGLGCRIETLTFEGWGHEDSDLVGSLFHAGIQRCNLRGRSMWHLWHPEEDRRRVSENDQLLRQCMEQKRIRAIRGIGELEEGEA